MIVEKKRELLGEYAGFEIYSPGYCPNDKLYIYLKRKGEYRLEISRTAQGMMVRIDNFLEKLNEYAQSIQDEMNQMSSFVRQAKAELDKVESYKKQIAYWTKILNDIDDKLDYQN